MKQQSGSDVRVSSRSSVRCRQTLNSKFTDEERIRALKVIDHCDGSLTLASRRLGVSIATLSRWRAAGRPVGSPVAAATTGAATATTGAATATTGAATATSGAAATLDAVVET